MNKVILIAMLPILTGCIAAAVVGGGAVAIADERTVGTVVEDQAIELKAIKSFVNDLEFKDNAHLNVVSYNNKVLLVGEAKTKEIRKRAVDYVRQIDKVTKIYNEVVVSEPSNLASRSKDTWITSKVKTKILATENLVGLKIKVMTDKKIVYLMGLITKEDADVAVEIVRHVKGIKEVIKLFDYSN